MNADRVEQTWLVPGARVEVLSRFSSAWRKGFEVAEVRDDGCRLRRRSDGVVLPAPIPVNELRPDWP